jgi:hypothetical protein
MSAAGDHTHQLYARSLLLDGDTWSPEEDIFATVRIDGQTVTFNVNFKGLLHDEFEYQFRPL